jgi:hypothetical protein
MTEDSSPRVLLNEVNQALEAAARLLTRNSPSAVLECSQILLEQNSRLLQVRRLAEGLSDGERKSLLPAVRDLRRTRDHLCRLALQGRSLLYSTAGAGLYGQAAAEASHTSASIVAVRV